MKRFLSFSLIIFFFYGCSWLSFGNNETDSKVVFIDEPLLEVKFVKSGRINNLKRLNEGGRLLVKPFSPGPDVEVSDKLDAVSLRIVRGILDVYEGKWPADFSAGDHITLKYDMALEEQEDEADLKLHGRITKISTSAYWKKWFFMKPKVFMSVEGWLVDVKEKATVLSFKDEIEAQAKIAADKDLALEIGRHIGQFIFTKR